MRYAGAFAAVASLTVMAAALWGAQGSARAIEIAVVANAEAATVALVDVATRSILGV